MEIFVLLFVGWIVYNIYSGYKQREAEEQIKILLDAMEEERRLNAFKCKITDDTFKGEDFEWDVFHVQMKGLIEGSQDDFPVKYIVQMADVTDGRSPILSAIDQFQSNDSTVFWFESGIDRLPYSSTIFKEWATTVKIPKAILEFPRSGLRKVEFKVFAVDANTDKILSQDSTTVSYHNTDKGYEEQSEHREYFEEMVVKTAMLVSASDGDMDTSEANVVKSWIQRNIERYKVEYRDEEKERLNGYIKEAYHDIQDDNIDIYDTLEGIENIASEGEKFELFQVCLDVAQADGAADEAELEIIHDIADYIHLDEKQFKSMIEKTLPITMHTSPANEESLLGITPNMEVKEIKRILREQYQKWNARVASSDPKIRTQAEEMIQLIAKARERY
ncbi:hypothetical protein TSL6_02120 [Sulfurovum sp. TSL6]|uniref:tellurite resistance TerB family protein n=1 Tax=Sulfurovum sp. TSL6 TaxID=2826995 RepID=UPI001CC3578D|nr:tellurite resistance TerB family protein [Sulfurovum sp. TSL6]GIT99705.1 hypothetical protein TSL6_02120 [Sulfurovum sp. TSL6]